MKGIVTEDDDLTCLSAVWDWRLVIGDWRLKIGDWRLEIVDLEGDIHTLIIF